MISFYPFVYTRPLAQINMEVETNQHTSSLKLQEAFSTSGSERWDTQTLTTLSAAECALCTEVHINITERNMLI